MEIPTYPLTKDCGIYHPVFLNKTIDSSIPVMQYNNQEIPISLKGIIDHIDLAPSEKRF